TITGTNFVGGNTAVTVSGTGIAINSISVANSTSLTATFVIDSATAPDGRTVAASTTFGNVPNGLVFTVLPKGAPLTAEPKSQSQATGAHAQAHDLAIGPDGSVYVLSPLDGHLALYKSIDQARS